MSARTAKWFLAGAAAFLLLFLGWPGIVIGCLLVIVSVCFGVMWERYSSPFSVLAGSRPRRKRTPPA